MEAKIILPSVFSFSINFYKLCLWNLDDELLIQSYDLRKIVKIPVINQK